MPSWMPHCSPSWKISADLTCSPDAIDQNSPRLDGSPCQPMSSGRPNARTTVIADAGRPRWMVDAGAM
jgi:hypothetical protein